MDIILGNPKFEGTLNKIVLCGKKKYLQIYRSNMEEELPSFNAFLRDVNKHYKIDKYIAKMIQKYEAFQMKSIRYNDLLDPSQ